MSVLQGSHTPTNFTFEVAICVAYEDAGPLVFVCYVLQMLDALLFLHVSLCE
jgi:hypothetical protein